MKVDILDKDNEDYKHEDVLRDKNEIGIDHIFVEKHMGNSNDLVSMLFEEVGEIIVDHKKDSGNDVSGDEEDVKIEQDHIFVGNIEVENCKLDLRTN